MRALLLVIWRLERGLWNVFRRLSSAEKLRFLVILLLGAVILGLIYLGTRTFLHYLELQVTFGYLSPGVILSILLSIVSLFVFFSSLSHMVGSLTQSADSDLLYSLPLSPTAIYFARLTETAFQSGWMSFLLTIPLLIAVGGQVHAPPEFLALGMALTALLFLAVSACAVCVAIGLIRLFPPALVSRYMGLTILAVLGGVLIYFIFSSKSESLVLQMVRTFSAQFLPSKWIGITLGEIALKVPVSPEACLAWVSFVGFAVGGGVFLSELSLRPAASRALARAGSDLRYSALARCTEFLPDPLRGVVLRELAFLLRSPSASLNILFLASLAFGYAKILGHFNFVSAPGLLDSKLWSKFFLGSNLAMGSYVATAFLSRLVLPITSLEGRAVWLSATSPCSPLRILRMRRMLWCIPTWLITVGIGGFGTFFITPQVSVRIEAVALSLLLGWFLVTLALASGARFSRFTWNHPGELIASFGSMVFMTVAVLIVSGFAFVFAFALSERNYLRAEIFILLSVLGIVFTEIFFRDGAAKLSSPEA